MLTANADSLPVTGSHDRRYTAENFWAPRSFAVITQVRVPPTPTMPSAWGEVWKLSDTSSRPLLKVAFHWNPVVGLSLSSTANFVPWAMSEVLPLSASVKVTIFFPSAAAVVVAAITPGLHPSFLKSAHSSQVVPLVKV